MNRHQYRLAYREARKADRFYDVMNEKFNVKVTSTFDTLDLCPRYDCCRLHGDHLDNIVGHMGQVTHRARMNHLRRPVRLPA